MTDVANIMRKIKNFEFSFEIGGFRLESCKIYSQDQFVIIQKMDVPGLITDTIGSKLVILIGKHFGIRLTF